MEKKEGLRLDAEGQARMPDEFEYTRSHSVGSPSLDILIWLMYSCSLKRKEQ